MLTLLRVGLISTALAFATPAVAAEWTMVSGLPDTSYFNKNYMEFIQEVEKESGGELKIKFYGNGTLVKRDAIRRAIQSGQVQMGEVDFTVMTNENPVFALDTLPGVATSYQSAWALMQAQKPYVETLYLERGLRAVGYAPWPGQGFFSKSPIQKLDDVKSAKLRIPTAPTRKMAEMLGFRPVILAPNEVTQAFASGMIDGTFTGPSMGVMTQTWDHTKYYLFVGAMFPKQALLVNEGAFKSLSPKVQKIVLDAGQRLTERGWKLSESDTVEQLKILERNGVSIAQPGSDISKRMDEISGELIEEWKKQATPEAIAVLAAYQSKVKK